MPVKTFEAINRRLCYIILKRRLFDMEIICCYGHTENKEDEKKKLFWKNLKEHMPVSQNTV